MAKSESHKASIQLIASTVVPVMGLSLYPQGHDTQVKSQVADDNRPSGVNRKNPVKSSRLKLLGNRSTEDTTDSQIEIAREDFEPNIRISSREVDDILDNPGTELGHSAGATESYARSQHSTLSQALEHAGDWTCVDAVAISPDPHTPPGVTAAKVKKQLTFLEDEPPEVIEREHFFQDEEQNWNEISTPLPSDKYLHHPRRSRTGKELWETMRLKMLETDSGHAARRGSKSDRTFVEITSPGGFFEMTPSHELSPSAKWHALVHQLLALKRSGQIPNGVLSLRTSFASRPSLVALGSRANNLTKIPVLVQTYSSGPNTDDESDDEMDRRNSAVIIASPGEATGITRNVDFCKVSVLMCELLLLIGLLVVVFSFSMKTSPTIKPWETPYWAGVPLIIAGSLGVSLRCRSWQEVCSDVSLKSLEVLFNLVVVSALLVCSIALVFSIDFFRTLLSLNQPTLMPLKESNIPVTPSSEIFVMSYCNFNQSNLFASSDQESSTSFLVAHIQSPNDCSDFLFNVMNYSFMLCTILLIAVLVSITIVSKSAFRFYRSVKMESKLRNDASENDFEDY